MEVVYTKGKESADTSDLGGDDSQLIALCDLVLDWITNAPMIEKKKIKEARRNYNQYIWLIKGVTWWQNWTGLDGTK